MSAPKFWTWVILAVTIGASVGVAVGSVGAAAPATISPGLHYTVRSTNWAGYAVTGRNGSVIQVTGSWVQPAVTCTHSTTYAAFWDGIDGYTSATVEQGGTLAYCSGGTPHYSAWYEFYPAASVTIGSITVHAGDNISVTVTYNSTSSKFSIKVQDGTHAFTKKGAVASAKRSSAECIAERPEVGTALTHLANFGTAKFGADYTSTIGCSATVSGTTGTFGSFATATAINMVDSGGKTLAATSALSVDGSSFTESWKASS
ncbi:MAG: G1 family endopeptidase [Thermoplasmata archaeon]|nr:G1 family endopeptidase [Thermoplasmata archaeon]